MIRIYIIEFHVRRQVYHSWSFYKKCAWFTKGSWHQLIQSILLLFCESIFISFNACVQQMQAFIRYIHLFFVTLLYAYCIIDIIIYYTFIGLSYVMNKISNRNIIVSFSFVEKIDFSSQIWIRCYLQCTTCTYSIQKLIIFLDDDYYYRLLS